MGGSWRRPSGPRSGISFVPVAERVHGRYERLIRAYYPLSDQSVDCVWLYYAGLHGKWATDSAYFKRLAAMTPQVAKTLGISMDTLRISHGAALDRGYPQGWMVSVVNKALG
jgi:hypothetical protein